MSLEPDGIMDATARILVTFAFFAWNLYEGSVFESAYPGELVNLYSLPFWRFLLAITILVAAYWCPRVASMVALAIFFYIEDLEKLLRPWQTAV